ncbi:hypothetical protein [Sphingomonas sp. ID0503]|uniref:hypothetical protein n=1 Tax=Sphingomonas sp. ID0503 TaxID=3399691 RepID=UPI003AFAF598
MPGRTVNEAIPGGSPTGASLAELAAALKVLQPPPAPVAAEATGIAKHAGTIVVAIMLALCLWVGATIYSLAQTTTQVSTKLDAMQKALDGMSSEQQQTGQRIAEIMAAQAKGDQRLTAVELEQQRMRERLRAVEGQAPLPSNASQ